jgi:hypothetical protein
MPLFIDNKGRGLLGAIGQGWRVNQNGAPAILGASPGRLGDVSFSAECDSTSKFTIDNYATVEHYADDQSVRWLSTFDGYIRSAEITGQFGSFSISSLLSALDVERTAQVDVSGTYQRQFRLPVMEYTIPSVGTYTTGGYWTSIGSENVFISQPITIYDVTAEENYVYVLASGGHAGEVVFQIGIDGYVRSVWPVYSDATDLASPGSRHITYGTGWVWVGQSTAKRVKRFVTDGTFVNQWGTAGSADGQFQTISGMAVNNATFDAIYITDSVLGRVQCFTEAGTFLFKWGTSGTGAGDLVFNAPNGISIDPTTDNVFVSDQNARVREYTSGGGYVSQPMGSYSFTSSTSTGEFAAGGYRIDTAFDHLGNAYASQLGKVFKYVRGANWTDSTGKPIKQWDGPDAGTDGPRMCITQAGILHLSRPRDYVMQYAASIKRVKEHVLYYVALAKPDFPVQLLSMSSVVTEPTYIGWTGNVWAALCELMASTGNSMVAFSERLAVFDRSARGFRLPDETEVKTLSLNSQASGRSIQIMNQNSVRSDGRQVMYSAEVDNGRTISVDTETFTYLNVFQNTYPEYVVNPTPVSSWPPGPGEYTVVDANGLYVTPTAWTNYGASIKARLSEEPGLITLVVTGPDLAIPGYEAPYTISSVTGQPALSILGAGIIANPEMITIGTGVSEEIAPREVAQTIDSPFAYNATVAYSEGSWAAYNSGTPDQKISFTFHPRHAPVYRDEIGGIGGISTMINVIIDWEDAQYIVEDLSYNESSLTLTCYRYTQCGLSSFNGTEDPRFEEIWSSKPTAEFEAFWAGYTAGDFQIAPLRNPYRAGSDPDGVTDGMPGNSLDVIAGLPLGM